MKFALSIFPTEYSIQPGPLARAAEERGFDALFVTEHTHIPASRRTPFPGGGDLPSIYWESYEPFTALAMAAAATERLKIGTGICLVPEHHPIALAKRVASLDVLSGGRFLFGIGAGWNAEELENHGVAFADRWKVTRESILAMKQCWTAKDAEYHGDFVDFGPIWLEPKPAQRPHPPIHIGANSRWAVRRVVEYADGWMPIQQMGGLEEGLALLDELCEAQGRDRGEIEVTLSGGAGSRDEVAELEAKGIDRLNFPVASADESKVMKYLDRLAPLLG